MSKKGNTDVSVETTTPYSSYAAKHPKGLLVEAPVTPDVLVGVFPVAEEHAAIDLFSDLDEFLLDEETKKDLDRMSLLRADAYELKTKKKAIRLNELQVKALREAKDAREEQPRDAARQIYNAITDAHRNDGKLEVYREAWSKWQNSDDPDTKAKYEQRLMAHIEKLPRMKALHERNLVRAETIMREFEETAALREKYDLDANDKFEEANIIATIHGWATTEAIKK
jgi:hypothetical protein